MTALLHKDLALLLGALVAALKLFLFLLFRVLVRYSLSDELGNFLHVFDHGQANAEN